MGQLFQATAKAIISFENKVLLVHRANEGIFWEVPGGRLEAGEQPLEALVRELGEETNLEFEAKPILLEAEISDYVFPDGERQLMLFTK